MMAARRRHSTEGTHGTVRRTKALRIAIVSNPQRKQGTRQTRSEGECPSRQNQKNVSSGSTDWEQLSAVKN